MWPIGPPKRANRCVDATADQLTVDIVMIENQSRKKNRQERRKNDYFSNCFFFFRFFRTEGVKLRSWVPEQCPSTIQRLQAPLPLVTPIDDVKKKKNIYLFFIYIYSYWHFTRQLLNIVVCLWPSGVESFKKKCKILSDIGHTFAPKSVFKSRV